MPAESRALAGLTLGAGLFVSLFQVSEASTAELGAARPLQLLAASAFSSSLLTAVCWQRFPGWELFGAGWAMVAAGLASAGALPGVWVQEAALGVAVALAWYAAARITEGNLVFPLGHGSPPARFRGERVLHELREGWVQAAQAAGLTALTLTPLFPSAAALAGPLGLSLGAGLSTLRPLRRALWISEGSCLGAPLAFLARRGLEGALGLPHPLEPPDPWVVQGLLLLGTSLGLWLARWRAGRRFRLRPNHLAGPLPGQPRTRRTSALMSARPGRT